MNPSSLLSYFNNTLASISSLPLAAHAIPIVLFICGLMFWLAGGRFLKLLFSLIGIASGAGLGAIFGPQILPDTVGPIPGPYVAMGAGGLLGLIASVLAFRFSMALCGAVVLAAAGALGMGVYLSHQPDALPVGPATEARDRLAPTAEELAEQLRKAADEYQKTKESSTATKPDPSAPSIGAGAAEATRQFADEVKTEAQELWTTTPEHSRLLLLVGAAAGAIVGAAAGMATPKRAASVITAVLGAGLTLIGASWLARAFDVPAAHYLTGLGPTGLLIAWGVLSAFGALVQLRSGGRKTPEKKPEPKTEPKTE